VLSTMVTRPGLLTG
nr:immunoglobulin heavy chain junction region [Mus musculus]